MWTLVDSDTVPLWRPKAPAPGATLVFSTRRGGVSASPFESLNLGLSTADSRDAILENRRLLLLASGLSPGSLATAGQVHGAHVAFVSEPGHTPDCDALVSNVPGLALAVTTADCMSLLYRAASDPSSSEAGTTTAAGAAHAGWRGTADGMPVRTLEAVCSVGRCDPAGVQVHIGPCIRGCCYEVGEEVAARFPAAALRRPGPKPYLDLPTVARLALEAAGVPATAIHDTGACTACEPYWYFSHRRDEGRTGRLWGVAAVTR
jgi:YfiH family protein